MKFTKIKLLIAFVRQLIENAKNIGLNVSSIEKEAKKVENSTKASKVEKKHDSENKENNTSKESESKKSSKSTKQDTSATKKSSNSANSNSANSTVKEDPCKYGHIWAPGKRWVPEEVEYTTSPEYNSDWVYVFTNDLNGNVLKPGCRTYTEAEVDKSGRDFSEEFGQYGPGTVVIGQKKEPLVHPAHEEPDFNNRVCTRCGKHEH